MRKHRYLDQDARKAFETRIKGVERKTLSEVLNGSNQLGRLRSWRIRRAWRKLRDLWPASEDAIRAQYCG